MVEWQDNKNKKSNPYTCACVCVYINGNRVKYLLYGLKLFIQQVKSPLTAYLFFNGFGNWFKSSLDVSIWNIDAHVLDIR